jgi:hypothetical protein
MNEETRLRELAREALRNGKLPNDRPHRMWGGPGCGASCAVCGLPIQANQTELELDFAREGLDQDNQHLHQHCFAAWEFERENGGAGRGASGPRRGATNGAGPRPDAANGNGGLALPGPNAVGMIPGRDHETSQ